MSEDKEKEVISVREFKAMIAGMDLIGGEEWSPDAVQWKRVREKIDLLAEEPDPAPVAVARTLAPQSNLRPANPNVVNPNNPWENGEVALPSVGGVPDGPTVMGASNSALAPPAAPTGPIVDSEEAAIKTPDIDSTAGYKSAFV